MARKKTPTEIELEVITKSRRRCCICYGLNRDESIKKGQIAHLDRDATNYNFDNLAYLCLEHHDDYDSRTSQSKGWSDKEAKVYRNELYERFSIWGEENKNSHLLNFLAFTIDLDDMLDAALDAVGEITFIRESTLEEILARDYIQYSDPDLWYPIMYTLQYLQSWGWVEFKVEEKEGGCCDITKCISITHKPICSQLLDLLKKRLKERDSK
jgi:hypothetical protein